MKFRSLFATLMLTTIAAPLPAADLPRTTAPEEAKLYFIDLKDGATVSNPVTVRFGLHGMGVAPAGIEAAKTGHHHLLIDTPLPQDMSQPLPANDNVRHFGGGQTEVTLQLSPGKHTLQLLLGDHLHRPHQPPVYSKPITITVK